MKAERTRISLPDAFIIQMQELLGNEWADFAEALNTVSPVSIRLNGKKPIPAPTSSVQVPWCPSGVYLPERKVFTLDPLFHAGCYYVQEASSMFIAEAIKQLVQPEQPLRVLDLCAAPGGKSTLLASVLPAGSLLLCNEVIQNRYHILRENLIKWGNPFTHTSNLDSSQFSKLNGFFDLILVDAPCSGEGLFRKDPDAIQEWSSQAIQHCSARQKRILREAVPLLKEGGLLIYSTCTYNRLENDENARWITGEFHMEEKKLEIPSSWGVEERDLGYQLYPHKVRGEGLFLSCFQQTSTHCPKKEIFKTKVDARLQLVAKRLRPTLNNWLEQPAHFDFFQDEKNRIYALPKSQTTELLYIRQQIRKAAIGTMIGTFKRNDFIPSPQLALSSMLKKEIPHWELSLDAALHYLKKENVTAEPIPSGWALATHYEHGLGWVKGLKNRVNNYYPKEWRIRMRLE